MKLLHQTDNKTAALKMIMLAMTVTYNMVHGQSYIYAERHVFHLVTCLSKFLILVDIYFCKPHGSEVVLELITDPLLSQKYCVTLDNWLESHELHVKLYSK